MKRFVTTLILMVSVMFLFVQCVGDPGYTTVYIYKNSTDYPIQIDLYDYDYGTIDGFKLVKTHLIESHDELKISLGGTGGGIAPPFANNKVFYKVIVTSNNIEVVETVNEPNSLLNESVYTIIPSPEKSKYYRQYEFTFTDSYFAKGTPVTP